MQQLTFSVHINATPQAVWNTLWNDTTYRQWTAVFNEGSHAISTWQEGDRIDFLGPDGSGMYATIVKKDTPNTISFLHQGEIKNQQEIPFANQDGYETYILETIDNQTKLTANMNMPDEFVTYFNGTFPKALQTVKQLAEANAPKHITVASKINASVEKVWAAYTNPDDIQKWNFASPDWHCPKASNDVRVGGKFSSTMAAKDGSFSFDFEGTYTEVAPQQKLSYVMDDGRKCTVTFEPTDATITKVTTTFEMENQNSEELQKGGWQSILENFKHYTETNF
jgi:uncharacterized protein YndB with AHSA1/START domain